MRALLFVAAVLGITACDLFAGPATQMSDDYLIKCGDSRCDPRWFVCSRTKPVTCMAAPTGAARDAGRD